jgi:ElaA protein
MRWTLRAFDALTPGELYGILALRQRVFVVEQACAYLDADGRDPASLHLFACDAAGRYVACLRVVPPGTKFVEPSLGRIATAPEVRRTGLGREIVARGIEAAIAAHGRVSIRISAQRYLERFYGEFGFVTQGTPYDEDGIPHVDMLLRA